MAERIKRQSLSYLYQINKNVYGLGIACGLDYYLSGENQTASKDLKILSLTNFDPMYCCVYDNVKEKDDYLDLGMSKVGAYSVLDYQKKEMLMMYLIYMLLLNIL